MEPTAASPGPALPGLAGHGAAPATRRALPPVGVYIRAVIALGLGSLRRGLPAVVFLYFYRLGMGLYLAFSMDESSSRLGTVDQEALLTSAMMQGAAYIPLLALVYTPFLPLQDSILAGGRRTLFESARIVLERILPFGISLVLQGLLIFGPPTLLFAGVTLMLGAVPQNPEELVKVVALLAAIPCVVWAVLIAILLMFSVPALVLESRGPVASIRVSLDLMARNFGGVLGRLFVFFLFALLLAMIASLPEAILQAASVATGFDAPLSRIARVIWSSAVAAFLFPFSVASLTVLYRALVPGPAGEAIAAAGGGARAASPTPPASGEPAPPASPFRFE